MTTRDASGKVLRVYVCGEGIGESVLLELPCGGWGLIDCYLPSASAASNMLTFMEKLGVKQLTFLCLTHPHADHYLGLDFLLREFAGRIERVWRHPGFTPRDILVRVLLAAKVKPLRDLDPEANRLADGYMSVEEAMHDVTKNLQPDCYRLVVGPTELLNGGSYMIEALGPCSNLIDQVEGKLGKIESNKGCLVFSDSEGRICNSLSIVLRLTFGQCIVMLLGDAVDEPHAAMIDSSRVTLLKVAHHGSSTGLGAKLYAKGNVPRRRSVKCAVVTPYLRSNLPRKLMVQNYATMCGALHITGRKPGMGSGRIFPGLMRAAVVKSSSSWVGFEITASGNVTKLAV